MLLPVAQALVLVVLAYAGIGLVFAVLFLALGLARVDPVARGASFGLRLLLLPGCAALWPLLALRWARGRQAPIERTPHKLRAETGERS